MAILALNCQDTRKLYNLLQFARHVATESFHFIIPIDTSKSNGIQGVCLRGARDENSSTYTCGLQEEQQKDMKTRTEAVWRIFNFMFTTYYLRRGQQLQ